MSTDLNVISENLTELLQNSINMTSVFYDIFLNPEPMDVELKQYDAEHTLVTISLPNRAKDRKIALDGEGSPEGVVEANTGACYVDTLNQVVYFKADNSGEATGWTPVLTQTGVNLAIQTYLANGHYVTTSYLDDNDYTTETDVVAKIDEKFAAWSPTIVMSDVTGQTAIDLTDHDNQGIYLTASEDVTFTLPIVVDLNILHKIFVQLNLTAGVTVTLGTTHFFENIEPTFVNAGMYNIIFEFDNAAGVWVAGATYKGQVSS